MFPTSVPIPSTVKLADDFRPDLAVTLALNVVADEAPGVARSGTAAFIANTQRFVVSLQLSPVPTTLDDLKREVATAVLGLTTILSAAVNSAHNVGYPAALSTAEAIGLRF